MKKLSLLLCGFLLACQGEDSSPRPRGYFRIDLPEKEYRTLSSECPYTFEINQKASWIDKDHCWGDVYYPMLKARLQLTYKAVNPENLATLLRDGQELAYKHTVRADGIEEKLYTNPERDVHGILYRIKGDAASSTQFFVTDSSNHFLRGVLYFYAEPNADSLRPVNEYMLEETVHLIETLQWQNSSP